MHHHHACPLYYCLLWKPQLSLVRIPDLISDLFKLNTTHRIPLQNQRPLTVSIPPCPPSGKSSETVYMLPLPKLVKCPTHQNCIEIQMASYATGQKVEDFASAI